MHHTNNKFYHKTCYCRPDYSISVKYKAKASLSGAYTHNGGGATTTLILNCGTRWR